MSNEAKSQPFGCEYEVSEGKILVFKYDMGLLRELNRVTKLLEGDKANFQVAELTDLNLQILYKLLWACLNKTDKRVYAESEVDALFPLLDDQKQSELITAVAGMMQEAVTEKKRASQQAKKKPRAKRVQKRK